MAVPRSAGDKKGHLLANQNDLPFGDRLMPGNHPQGGSLSTPGGPKKTDVTVADKHMTDIRNRHCATGIALGDTHKFQILRSPRIARSGRGSARP